MNNFRKTLREKSTEELINILKEVERDYGDDSLNAAREQTIKLIENILKERDVDVENIGAEEEEVVSRAEEEISEAETESEEETEKEQEKVEETKSEPRGQRQRKVSVRNNQEKNERKYRTLRFLASFIKISAILFFVLIIVGNVVSEDGFFTSLMVIIISLIILIPYFSLSELIYLFLDIEENTRVTKEILNRFYRGG